MVNVPIICFSRGSLMRVYLYDEGSCAVLRAKALADELTRLVGGEVILRAEFARHWSATAGEGARATADALARALVAARVAAPLEREQHQREPLAVEVAAERRALQTPGRTSAGILYDGAVVQWLMAELIDKAEADDCHLVLTGRLLGTFMAEDRRWHAHTVILGEPNLISTTGLVQAPARPREFYRGQAMATTGLMPREVVEAELAHRLSDRMLLPDDSRLTEAALGCALQAVAYHVSGEAFCPEPTCRLFNARRQEELIRCQCSAEARLCPRHETLFDALRREAHG
jgi:hypothetical protein